MVEPCVPWVSTLAVSGHCHPLPPCQAFSTPAGWLACLTLVATWLPLLLVLCAPSYIADAAAQGITLTTSQITVLVTCVVGPGRRLATLMPIVTAVFDVTGDAATLALVGDALLQRVFWTRSCESTGLCVCRGCVMPSWLYLACPFHERTLCPRPLALPCTGDSSRASPSSPRGPWGRPSGPRPPSRPPRRATRAALPPRAWRASRQWTRLCAPCVPRGTS